MPIIASRASAAYGAGFGKTLSSSFAPVGAYDALATITVPSGGAGVVTMTGIPSTYQHLQIRVSARLTSVNPTNYMWFRLNGESSSSYNLHQWISFGVSSSSSYNGAATFGIAERLAGGGAPTNVFGAIILDIFDYNSSKLKTIKSLGGVESNSNNTNGSVYFNGNIFNNAQAVRSIDFAQETGNFVENTIISLYGVK